MRHQPKTVVDASRAVRAYRATRRRALLRRLFRRSTMVPPKPRL